MALLLQNIVVKTVHQRLAAALPSVVHGWLFVRKAFLFCAFERNALLSRYLVPSSASMPLVGTWRRVVLPLSTMFVESKPGCPDHHVV